MSAVQTQTPSAPTMDPVLLNLLKEELSSDEQQLFIDSFALYLEHDPFEFVIDFDNVWRWIGFSRKDHAKRVVTKHTLENVDYKIVREENVVSPQIGNNSVMNGSSIGRPRERIMLTPNGFKDFCMQAGTDKGRQVRRYYIAMETICQRYVRQTLADRDAQLAAKDVELEAVHSHIEALSVYERPECDGHLYSVNTDIERPDADRKVGVTTDLKKRIKNHRTTNTRNGYDIAREVPCNFGLQDAEKILAKYLKFAGHHLGGECYRVPRDYIRNWITIVTGLAHACRVENVLRDKVISEVATIIDKYIFHAPTINPIVIPSSIQNIPEEGDEGQSETEDVIVHEHHQQPAEEQFRFDQFISEMCVTSDITACAPTVMIAGAYRLWSRTAKKTAYHALLRYLGRRFRPVRVPSIHSSDSVMNGYEGISLIPRPPRELPAVASNAERFLHAEAEFVPHGKVLLEQLSNEFKNWLRRVRPDVPFSDYDILELRTELDRDREALQAVIWTPQGNGVGFYGVHLKCNDAVVNRKPSSTSKVVEKIDVGTGQVLNRWTTIAKAAEAEHIAPAKLSRMIKGCVQQNGVMYCASKGS